MTLPQSITEADVVKEFIDVYPDEDVGITTMFGKMAYGTAAAMHAQRDVEEDFDWIRNSPLGGIAYRTAVWQFLAILWENTTGEEYDADPHPDEDDLDSIGYLSVTFGNIAFETYNQLSGKEESDIAELHGDIDAMERAIIAERTAYFYNTYLLPQFKMMQLN